MQVGVIHVKSFVLYYKTHLILFPNLWIMVQKCALNNVIVKPLDCFCCVFAPHVSRYPVFPQAK